jgi:hypothetical protein
MNKKKIFTIAIALVLVVAMTVAGTLAVLKEKSEDTLTNTFVAAGAGDIIVQPLSSNFLLKEHKVTYDDATAKYTASTTEEVTSNEYTGVAPGMDIPKDPTVKVNVKSGASAYIFVKIVDSAPLLTWEPASGWTKISETTAEGVTTTVLAWNAIVTGGTAAEDAAGTFDLTQAVLKDNKVSIASTAEIPEPASGETTVSLGSIVITAYACQAQGFDSASAAWTASGF